MTLLFAATIKATLALALSLAVVCSLRRATAATRHSILVAGQIAALLVPLLAFAVPPLAVPVPRALPLPDDHATFTGVVATARMQPAKLESRPDMVWFVWAFGCAVIVCMRAASLLRAAAIIRSGAAGADLVFSDLATQPSTLGRTIVLPSAARNWDERRLRAVLLHERAHVTRHDSLTGVLADVVCAIYWFHPLAWIAARRTSLERERACDDAVLAHGIDARDYASAILEVARASVRGTAVGLPMAARPHLEQRIRAILNPGVQRTASRLTRVLVAFAAIAAAPLLAALTTAATIARPATIEPDLRGDDVASPFSEFIGAPPIEVAATGPDAALIATLQQVSMQPPRAPDDFVADRARWALAQVRDGELVAPLIESLEDHDWRVRAYAAFNLGVAGDRRATAGLVRQLDHPVWRVRAMAASALAAIADPAASAAMHRALSDDAWQVRSEAVRYFASVGAPRVLFQTMLRDRHMAVRAAAEEALR